MRNFVAEKANNSLREDQLLSAGIFLLTGIGLVTLYSTSHAFAQRFYGSGNYFISRQIIFCVVGIILFFICSRINLEIIRKLVKPMIILSAVLCVLTYVPGIGVVRNGASRWINLGVTTYQPSEMVKFVLPLYLAHIFDKKKDKIDVFSTGVLPPVLISLLFFALICFQNNFSTAFFIAANALVIFFLAGVRLRYFFGAALIFLPLSALVILTKTYRVNRLRSFLWPDWEVQGAGYQVRSSVQAIMSGGFWGKGVGQGTRKVSSVPEIHSDFIFSGFSEESGFLGVLLIFLLFAAITYLGYRGALRADTIFKRLVAASFVTLIASQALLNVAVISGALPATGIPLPFFSAGGSSLATTLACAGLVVNVCRSREKSLTGENYNGR